MTRRQLRIILYRRIKVLQLIVSEFLQDLVHQRYRRMNGGTRELGGRCWIG